MATETPIDRETHYRMTLEEIAAGDCTGPGAMGVCFAASDVDDRSDWCGRCLAADALAEKP
jgi:hypothetical protein